MHVNTLHQKDNEMKARSPLPVILFLISIIVGSTAFFFFNKKEDIVYATLPVSKIRGVTSHNEEIYTSNEQFVCKDGRKSINQSSINDDYCDCEDGSDEPGTSACSYVSTSFQCVNKGYRTLKLHTSRVDDGICDCCDGSDEGNIVKCQNVCDKAAKKEREQLEQAINSYNIGSKILADMEKKVRNDLVTKSSMHDAYKKEFDLITTRVASLKSQFEHQTVQIQEHIDEMKSSATEEILNILKPVSESSITEIANFLISLFNALGETEQSISDMFQMHSDGDDHGIDGGDNHEHIHDPYEDEQSIHHDGYSEGDEVSNIAHEEGSLDQHMDTKQHEAVHNDVDVSTDEILVNTEQNSFHCEIFELSSDPRMKQFCFDTVNAVTTFLVDKYIPTKKPFKELQLLIGHYFLRKTFKGGENFVQDILLMSDGADVCPVSFESIPPFVCQIAEKLTTLYGLLDQSIDNIDDSNQLLPLSKFYLETKSLLKQVEQDLTEAEDIMRESKGALEDLNNPHLAILAYKGDKISVKDAQYIYSVNILDRVTQGDEHGHNDVSLGQYDHIEEQDDGTMIWKFKDGQYCYNFGARMADVHVKCGPENKLLSAREPSTCYYLLHAESPLACTKAYAQSAGIDMDTLEES
jgi:Glucosidase II beta subunit-like/Glucosidase II beta subunit-like protein